jgi:hypothetical protein
MEAALLAAFLADAGVTTLIGDRAAWDELPQKGKLPFLALHLFSGAPSYTNKGRCGLTPYGVQAHCWGGTPREATTLRNAVIAATDALKLEPLQVFVEGMGAGFEEGAGPEPSGASNFHRRVAELRVWHQAS